MTSHTEDIGLRPAKEEDCWDIFRWRNDPITIRFSPSGVVRTEEHEQWFRKRLNSKDTVFYIIYKTEGEARENKMGVIRFDQSKDHAEVSINLDPAHRGVGYGVIALKKAITLYFKEAPVKKITARIMYQNIPSRKLFMKLGFLKTAEDKIVGYYELLREFR